MRKNYFFLVLLLQLFKQNHAQLIHEPLNLPYEKEEKINAELAEYKIHLHEKYDTLLDKIGYKDDFVNSLISANKYYFESGKIYYNWPEAEDYLLAIIKKTLGEKWNPSIRVKIVRDPEDNAFMIEDGTIYFNIGMFSNINSEAELASVIGHEFGHYINLDSYRSFVEELKVKKKERILNSLGVTSINVQGKKFRKFRQFEGEADQIGFDILKNGEYNPYGYCTKFSKYMAMEEKYKKSKFYRPYYFNDHPSSEDRLIKANEAFKGIDTSGRKWFIVSSEKFNYLKRKAIDESILLFLQNLDFSEAIELCYRELLQYPNDEFYLFYISESIRRYNLENPKKIKERFISNNYYYYSALTFNEKQKPLVLSGSQKYFSLSDMRSLIFYTAPVILFYNKDYKTENLPLSDLTKNDTLEFFNYQDALDYFISRQKKLGYNARYFTRATEKKDSASNISLFNSGNPYLRKYKNISTDITSYLANPAVNNKTNFIFYNIEGYDKSYSNNFEADRCCADTLEQYVNSYCSKNCTSNLMAWSFDSVRHTDRNEFLLFTDALLTSYSDNDIRMKDLNGFEIDKMKRFEADALGLYPEIIDFIKPMNVHGTALISLKIDFLPPNPMASYDLNLPGVMLGRGLVDKAFSQYKNNRVIFFMDIHYIDYTKKEVIHKIKCMMYPTREYLGTALLDLMNQISILADTK